MTNLIRKRRRTREATLAAQLKRQTAAREVAEARAKNLEAMLARPLTQKEPADPGTLGAVVYLESCLHGIRMTPGFCTGPEFRSWTELDPAEREIWTALGVAVWKHLTRYPQAQESR